MSWFRHRIPNRTVRLALLSGMAIGAVALIGALLVTAFDGRRASTPEHAATPPARGGAIDIHKPDAKASKNSRTRRIRVGQTLSMTTLQPLKHKHPRLVRKVRKVRKLQSISGPERAWTLVASPANAEVTHQPGASTFTPDVHGTYVFKRPSSEEQGAGSRTQTLVLEVDPVEKLLCVNTRAWHAGDAKPPFMKVGDTELPRDDEDFVSPVRSLQVVVLERKTAGFPNDIPHNSTFPATNEGYGKYQSFLKSLDDNSRLVLVNGTLSASTVDQVWKPLADFGAADLPSLDPNQEYAFSFIGVYGTGKGTAWQTVAPSKSNDSGDLTSCDHAMAAQQASNLSGWLTLDTTGSNYTYVSPDFVDFDTDAKAPSGQHAIEVGNRTYTIPTGPWNGFHAVVLDRRAICPETTPLESCDPGDPLLNQGFGPENGGLDAMNAALAKWADNSDALLFLAPFAGSQGTMAGVVPSIDLITTLRRYGASPLAPGRSLDPGAKYALIAGGMNTGYAAGSAKPIVAESSTGFAHGTGHIAGKLVRDRQNRFGPREASLTGEQLATLGEVVYGPRSDWPEKGQLKLEAAFAYISGQLYYPVGKENPNGIRDQYTEWTTVGSVPDPTTALHQDWCTSNRPETIDATACSTVLHELNNEFLEVKYVDDFLDRLQKAYFEIEGGNEGDRIIKTVEDDITKIITPPPAKTSLAMTIMHFVLSVASVIPEAGEVFEVVGAELDLAESLSADSDGNSADPMQVVYETGDKLLDAAEAGFGTAVNQLDAYQPLIVSDYAKLTLVGHKAATFKFGDGSDLPETPWVISNAQLANTRTGLETALKQWLYPPLIDSAFPVWRIAIPSSNGWNNAARTAINYRCTGGGGNTHPFYAEPANGWIQLGNGHGLYTLALGGTRYGPEDLQSYGHHAAVPDAGLLAEVFGPATDHVGVDRTWYFEHFFKRQLDENSGSLVLDCWAK